MQLADYRRQLSEELSISAQFRGHALQFRTTWGLFSPREIDAGTELLLRYIEVDERDECLDLGCGYGPIGLTLARMAPAGRTTLVDKDFVAVEYAEKNARLNSIKNCEALLSNGFSHLGDRRFDLIASNLPAKVGRELLYCFLIDARNQLNPGGRLYVVTISGLRRFIQRAFEEVFGNYDKVKQGKDYTVALGCLEAK